MRFNDRRQFFRLSTQILPNLSNQFHFTARLEHVYFSESISKTGIWRERIMASLPSYVAAAQPVPKDKRAPWFKTTAQTYAGIMLWFVFWVSVPIGSAYAPGSPYSRFAGGTLSQGIGVALIGLVIAAL